MIKAIIFDCFGVVVGKGIWSIYDIAGGDSVRDADHLDHILNLANTGQITGQEFHELITSKLDMSVEEWKELAEREEKPNIELLEYIRDTLKPQYKIGFLSNVNLNVIDRKLPKKWQKLFDTMIISAEVGMMKPDVEIFNLAARRLNVKPNECVFTDDVEKYIDGAKKAGMTTIHYKNYGQFIARLSRLTGRS